MFIITPPMTGSQRLGVVTARSVAQMRQSPPRRTRRTGGNIPVVSQPRRSTQNSRNPQRKPGLFASSAVSALNVVSCCGVRIARLARFLDLPQRHAERLPAGLWIVNNHRHEAAANAVRIRARITHEDPGERLLVRGLP